MNLTDIKTVEDWKEVIGTRFRLTQEEKARGLSREEALAERVRDFQRISDAGEIVTRVAAPSRSTKASRSTSGDINIRIRPCQGVDPEYFQQIDGKPLEIVLDEKWYGWIDSKLSVPYDGDLARLIKHILSLGLGEVITNIKDFSGYEFLDQ